MQGSDDHDNAEHDHSSDDNGDDAIDNLINKFIHKHVNHHHDGHELNVNLNDNPHYFFDPYDNVWYRVNDPEHYVNPWHPAHNNRRPN